MYKQITGFKMFKSFHLLNLGTIKPTTSDTHEIHWLRVLLFKIRLQHMKSGFIELTITQNYIDFL